LEELKAKVEFEESVGDEKLIRKRPWFAIESGFSRTNAMEEFKKWADDENSDYNKRNKYLNLIKVLSEHKWWKSQLVVQPSQ